MLTVTPGVAAGRRGSGSRSAQREQQGATDQVSKTETES